jgi:hypothetical protein
MARRQKFSESFRSIAGSSLVGLGLHILFGNLDRITEQVQHLLGGNAGEALGVLPSSVLAASHAAQAYALDHQGFLQGLLPIFWSFWPLFLVIAGTVLLRDVVTDKVKGLPASKYFQNKNTGCRFHCASFDA